MTTASKHTPGPWHREGFGQNARGQKFILVSHGRNAQCDGPEGYVGELYVSEADARLMIAAPDLFSELSDLTKWLEDNQRSIAGEFSMDSLLEGPRAAISKADGR